jgi:hypothetical protein
MLAFEPSEYIPVATNVWAIPTGKLDGDIGAIKIEDKVGGDTDKLAGALIIPDSVAMILVFPTVTAVTKPVEEIVAIVGSELAHTTLEDTSTAVPSE